MNEEDEGARVAESTLDLVGLSETAILVGPAILGIGKTVCHVARVAANVKSRKQWIRKQKSLP